MALIKSALVLLALLILLIIDNRKLRDDISWYYSDEFVDEKVYRFVHCSTAENCSCAVAKFSNSMSVCVLFPVTIIEYFVHCDKEVHRINK